MGIFCVTEAAMKNLFDWMKMLVDKLSLGDVALIKVLAFIGGIIIGVCTPKNYKKVVLAFCAPVLLVLLPLFLYRTYFLTANENKELN